jgi:serine/threonine protein kinase
VSGRGEGLARAEASGERTGSASRSGLSQARYVCLQRIGRGGMAELFLARREGPAGFRKLVALKRLLPHLADDPTFARMFIGEARLAASLVHPHVAQVLDVGELEGRSFLAMEYVHGQDLRAVLQRAGKALPERCIPLPCALAVIEAVADALHHAHELRGAGGRPLELVHRDVSPSNVLLGYDGSIKLTDFGIAKANAETQVNTATQSLKGKIAYMSPEQARGERVDRRSDVFSLGIVMFEVTTGYRLFSGPSEFAILNQVARGEIASPRDVLPEYPEALEAIVMRALAPSLDDRYPTAQALAQDVRAYAAAHDARADREALASLMGSLFEATPYPDPDASAGDGETQDLGPATRSRYDAPGSEATTKVRRRSLPAWGWAVLTLGVGVGLGAALATRSGREEPAEKAAEVQGGAAKSQDGAAKPPAAVLGVSGEAGVEAGSTDSAGSTGSGSSDGGEVVIESEAAAVEDEPAARVTKSRTKPRRTTTTKTKKDDGAPSKGLDRWKLPSER